MRHFQAGHPAHLNGHEEVKNHPQREAKHGQVVGLRRAQQVAAHVAAEHLVGRAAGSMGEGAAQGEGCGGSTWRGRPRVVWVVWAM